MYSGITMDYDVVRELQIDHALRLLNEANYLISAEKQKRSQRTIRDDMTGMLVVRIEKKKKKCSNACPQNLRICFILAHCLNNYIASICVTFGTFQHKASPNNLLLNRNVVFTFLFPNLPNFFTELFLQAHYISPAIGVCIF